MLVLAITTVFLAGLMVAEPRSCTASASAGARSTGGAVPGDDSGTAAHRAALTAVVPALRSASITQPGPHGLSDALYAYASAANNNGSAFASFGAATAYQNVALGIVMMLGRFVPAAS